MPVWGERFKRSPALPIVICRLGPQSSPSCVRFHLAADHLVVDAAGGHELVVRAAFG